ncbi:MAG: VOC family protein [Jatrophihabitans sp.]|uniref:VOC family protein n=1 Tax=Jatrophihabitans sp. TaxID=1932789 RepID=UPI003F80A1C9
MPIDVSGLHHVRLTVQDIARSREFNDKVFGLPVAYAVPDDADETTREALSFLYGGVIYRLGQCLFGLRPVGTDRFDEDRVGLDHVAFTVADRSVLERAVETLDGLGIAHEPIKDLGTGDILEFRDPDNIALELYAPKG